MLVTKHQDRIGTRCLAAYLCVWTREADSGWHVCRLCRLRATMPLLLLGDTSDWARAHPSPSPSPSRDWFTGNESFHACRRTAGTRSGMMCMRVPPAATKPPAPHTLSGSSNFSGSALSSHVSVILLGNPKPNATHQPFPESWP